MTCKVCGNPKHRRTIPLVDFYMDIKEILKSNSDRAQAKLKSIEGELCHYTAADADYWFNLAAVAGKLRLLTLRRKIRDEGLREHPKHIDLLLDKFQETYSTTYEDTKASANFWNRLSRLSDVVYYWRYWVYGALFHAKLLRDRETAISLLNQGLLHVSSDHLIDIIRAYRKVLIDQPPPTPPDDIKDIVDIIAWREAMEEDAFGRLETIYRWGIERGFEGGHVLASDLATLYQECIAKETLSPAKREDLLNQAYHYLDLAEKLFTGVQHENHPLWEIYLSRARIVMGLNRYTDALRLFSVVPDGVRSASDNTQMKLAAEMVGKPLGTEKRDGDSGSGPLSPQQLTPQQLFDQVVERAQELPQFRAALIKLAQHFQNGDE